MIQVPTLRLLILMYLVGFTVSRELKFKVKYEFIEDFGQFMQRKLEGRHEILRRAIPPGPPDTTESTGGPTTTKLPISTPKPANTTPRQFISTTRSSNISSGVFNISEPIRSTNRPVVTTIPTKINIREDNHIYYTSQYYLSGEKWWFNLEDGGTPTLHDELSRNLVFSDTIKISFKFPFYGHLIDNVTITNKGYVFLGDTVHKYNASTQYVAPLMADFEPQQKTKISYIDTGDRFTVEWENLRFKNQPAGDFSFQCSILKNGTLVFAYKHIPYPVIKLKNSSFQLRVGLSDSFLLRYISRGRFFINGRTYTYVNYHRIQLPFSKIRTGSAFLITPQPNCVMFNSCDACVNSKTAFNCTWCPNLNRCSDGIDRHRYEWILSGCEKNNQTTCPTVKTPEPVKRKDGGQTRKSGGQNKGEDASQFDRTKTSGRTPKSGKDNKSERKPKFKLPTKEEKKPESKGKKKVGETPKSNTTEHKKQEEVNKTVEIKQPRKANKTIQQVPDSQEQKGTNESDQRQRSGISAVEIVVIVFSLGIILAVICWFVYAYRHPQSRSGMFLIEHRNPKKWFRNSGGGNKSTGGRVHFVTGSYE